MRESRAYDPVKRALDLSLSVIGLIVTMPVMAVVAILIRIKLGSPVLFRQPRPGLHGEIFQMTKFRTMREPREGGQTDSDADRLTNLGRRLRALSLDELPTLINVVRGDMSLVGPRPLLVSYLDRYTPEQARRHEVRPGVTGLAQISGRNALTWEEKFRLDIEYVDHRSLRLDLLILLKSVVPIVRGHGVQATGEATTTEFTGVDSDR